MNSDYVVAKQIRGAWRVAGSKYDWTLPTNSDILLFSEEEEAVSFQREYEPFVTVMTLEAFMIAHYTN